MSVVRRLKSLLGRRPDQQEVLRQEVARLEASVVDAMAAVEGLRRDIRDLERRSEELRAEESQWERDATQCLRRQDEATARECLQRAEAAASQRAPLAQRHAELQVALEKREQMLADLRRQLEDYRTEASSLGHRGDFSRAAKTAYQGADRIGAEGTGLLSDVRREVEGDELEAEVRAELGRAGSARARLEPPAEDRSVDARLEALRKQLDRG